MIQFLINKTARYIRVSTLKQKIDRQLKKEPFDYVFIDVVSGSIPFKNRPEAQKLIKLILEGEIKSLHISSIDRLGRNLLDILNTLAFFEDNNILVFVENIGIPSVINNKPNPAFRLIIAVMANIAQMERETMLERQREGINIAIAQGKYKGRVKGSSETSAAFLLKYKSVVKELNLGVNSMRKIAKICQVSLGTVQKVKRILKSKRLC